MNGQFEAAWRLHRFLTEREVPYAIIGGLAVQQWGEPRLTLDVDLTVLLPPGGEEPTLRELVEAFEPRVSDPVAFALKHRILPLRIPGASTVDLALGLPGYEEQMIARAAAVEVAPGRIVRVCTAEDLVIHKAVSGRPQDLIDLEQVVARQRRRLDVAYVRRWLRVFAEINEEPAIVERFEQPWSGLAE